MVLLKWLVVGVGIKYQEITVEVENSFIPSGKRNHWGDPWIFYFLLQSTILKAKILKNSEEDGVLSDKTQTYTYESTQNCGQVGPSMKIFNEKYLESNSSVDTNSAIINKSYIFPLQSCWLQ